MDLTAFVDVQNSTGQCSCLIIVLFLMVLGLNSSELSITPVLGNTLIFVWDASQKSKLVAKPTILEKEN